MIQKWFLHQPENIFDIFWKKSLKEEKAKLAFKSQVHSAFLLKSEDSVKDKEWIWFEKWKFKWTRVDKSSRRKHSKKKWTSRNNPKIFSISSEKKKSLKEEKAKLAFKSQVHSAFLLKSEDSEKR